MLVFPLLAVYRIGGKGMAFELLRRLSFDRWTLITLSPLPATGRRISGHKLSGKQLDNVF